MFYDFDDISANMYVFIYCVNLDISFINELQYGITMGIVHVSILIILRKRYYIHALYQLLIKLLKTKMSVLYLTVNVQFYLKKVN